MSKSKEPKFKLKKDKEYNIHIDNIMLDTWGEDWEYNMMFVKMSNDNTMYEFTNKLGSPFFVHESYFLGYTEPVSATEMFQMHTNYMNFYRKGPLQDLKYAQELRQKIINTLKERSYVIHGAGKLEGYDYRLMYDIRNDIDSGLYRFEVGKKYKLQNGDYVTIIARIEDMVFGSDGIWRYDNYNESTWRNFRYGLCVGTSWEFLDGRNIVNEELGNRFEIIQEFKAEYGYTDPDINLIGNTTRITELYEDYFKFLKRKNISHVNPYFDRYI